MNTEDPILWLQLATLGALLLGLWFLGRRVGGDAAEQRDASVRFETRLQEHTKRMEERSAALEALIRGLDRSLREDRALAREEMGERLGDFRQRFERRQGEALNSLQEALQKGLLTLDGKLSEALERNTEKLVKQVGGLTETADQRLKEISGQVEKRLSEGFEKTTETFTDIVKRLALIDAAQKKITELSSHVISLQQVLDDKRSRGAFGEVQLAGLVRNVLPESSFALQHTLGNGKIADCILFLPPPTGNVAIDAKFPLESYRRMTDNSLDSTERKMAERQFKLDIRKHIQDISTKYILPGETSDGAVMFLPAEAVFAEIQAHHPDLVEEAQKSRVWIVSPTTLMAILNTARAVLKDEATREQVHVIQEHLGKLAEDFGRFEIRMDKLSRHIDLAHKDVKEVHTSARKISSRFVKIEQVELEGATPRISGAMASPAPGDDDEAPSESG